MAREMEQGTADGAAPAGTGATGRAEDGAGRGTKDTTGSVTRDGRGAGGGTTAEPETETTDTTKGESGGEIQDDEGDAAEDEDEEEPWETYPLGHVAANVLLTLAVAYVSYRGMQAMPSLARIYLAGFLLYYLVIARLSRCASCRYYGRRCAQGWGWLVGRVLLRARGEAGGMLDAFFWLVWFRVLPGLVLLSLALDSLAGPLASSLDPRQVLLDPHAWYMVAFLLLQFAWSWERLLSCAHCRNRAGCLVSPYCEL